MRPQDVINILKVHLEVVERQGGFNPPEQDTEWTEDELAEIDLILEEIETEKVQERPAECSSEDSGADYPEGSDEAG